MAKVGTRWKEVIRKENNLYWYRDSHLDRMPRDILTLILEVQQHAVSYPADVIEKGCLLQYEANSFYELLQAQALYSMSGKFSFQTITAKKEPMMYGIKEKVGIPSSLEK